MSQPLPGLLLRTPYGDLHVPVSEQVKYPDRFFVWIADHWHVYKEFVERARQAKAWGEKQYGAKAICENIRWDWLKKQHRKNARQRAKSDPFALNNNYTAGLARLAMKQFPELDGFFKCRTRDGNDEKQEQAA